MAKNVGRAGKQRHYRTFVGSDSHENLQVYLEYYTDNLRNAIKLSREIRAGIVTVNCFGEGDASTPFGGYKQSGFGGRDKSIWAHDQYTEIKTIWIDVSEG